MKNFDWNGFEFCSFKVKCETREAMQDFLRQCEERGFMWASGGRPTQNDYFNKYSDGIYITAINKKLSYSCFVDNSFPHVTWETPNSTYTWREVFANIQEGETYECGGKPISYKDGILIIGDEVCITVLTNDDLFTKQELVDFQEALVELTNGGIVQSTLNKKYYLLTNGNLKCSCDKGFEYWELTDLSYEEITGKWNIIKN